MLKSNADSRKQLNRKIGQLGEDAAVSYLRTLGYRILTRNFRCKAGEIDVIAEKNDELIFVEVKTRSPRAYLPPSDAVDDEKQRRILAAAKYYLAGFREPSPQRYDIISVLLDDQDRVTQIELTSAAFA